MKAMDLNFEIVVELDGNRILELKKGDVVAFKVFGLYDEGMTTNILTGKVESFFTSNNTLKAKVPILAATRQSLERNIDIITCQAEEEDAELILFIQDILKANPNSAIIAIFLEKCSSKKKSLSLIYRCLLEL